MVVRINLILFLLSTSETRFESEALKENIENGQSKYLEFQENAKNSRNKELGSCWKNALEVSKTLHNALEVSKTLHNALKVSKTLQNAL